MCNLFCERIWSHHSANLECSTGVLSQQVRDFQRETAGSLLARNTGRAIHTCVYLRQADHPAAYSKRIFQLNQWRCTCIQIYTKILSLQWEEKHLPDSAGWTDDRVHQWCWFRPCHWHRHTPGNGVNTCLCYVNCFRLAIWCHSPLLKGCSHRSLGGRRVQLTRPQISESYKNRLNFEEINRIQRMSFTSSGVLYTL